jgi:hypothetical protein
MSSSTHRLSQEISRSEISVRRESANLGNEPGFDEETIKTRYMVWQRVKKNIVDSLLSTTVHGLPSIVSAKHVLIQIMWFFFILASGGACSYLIIKNIQDFFKYEVVTVTSSQLEIPTLFPVKLKIFILFLIFPINRKHINLFYINSKKTVTICNFNPFLSDSAMQFAQTILTQNGLGSTLNDTVNFPSILKRLFFPRYFVGMNSRNPNITDSVRKAIFMSMEQ